MKFRSCLFKKTIIAVVALISLVSVTAVAQEEPKSEPKSEVSVEGSGLFTKDSNGKGIENEATKTGGVQAGYRYNINHWLAAEADYGYARNAQLYYSGDASARVQANLHEITGAAVVKLPHFAKVQPFVLAGGGGLIFDPTKNAGGSYPGATWQARGAILYGGGADYVLTKHIALRAEYRGFVYKVPSFNVSSLNADSWTHLAQPSAGIVYRF
jgi:opacity protein-like surface antigen